MRILYHHKRLNDFVFKLVLSAGQTINLPFVTGKSYNCVVIWGDGKPNTKITTASASHIYDNAGTYTVSIRGICQGFSINNSNSAGSIRLLIREVLSWGTKADFRILDFWGCSNLISIPHDENGIIAISGASNITTFAHLLRGCTGYTLALNDRLFMLCPNVTSFESTFESSGVSGSIPENQFQCNTQALTFKRTFYSDASISGSVPQHLFRYNTLVQSFEETFGYSGISGNIPSLLFSYCNTHATNFKGTFRNTNLGNASESLPADIYDTNTQATDFSYNLYATKFTCNIPLLFQHNSNVTTFAYTFSSTPFSGVIPVNIFATVSSSVLSFEGTFAGTSIAGIPDHLFWYNINATTWHACFAQCYNLTKSNGGLGYDIFNTNLFKQNIKAKKFSQLFWDDSNIQMPLPEEMFWNNAEIDDMWGCFGKVAIEGPVPKKFHWYMPKLTSLSYTYYQGGWGNYTLNGDIDPDLFIYNLELTDVSWLFRWRHGIGKIPNGLFRNNKKITNFTRAFNCYFAHLEQYVFSDSNDASAYERFEGFAPTFDQCFNGGDGGYISLNVAPTTDWAPGDLITGQSSNSTCRIISKIDSLRYYCHSLSGSFQSGEIVGVTGNPDKLADQGTNYPTFAGWFNTRYAQELWNPSKYNIYTTQCETRQRPSSLWVAGDIIEGLTSGANFTVVTDQTTTRWTFYIKDLEGTFQNGETIGVVGNTSKQIVINTSYLWFTFSGRILNINVSPVSDWVRGDIITGQTSGTTCIIHSKISATSYYIRDVLGTFIDGETIGVNGNANKMADQDTGAPNFSYLPSHGSCFGGGASQYSNYAQIPSDWR